jgi:hypothetical protein
MALLASASMSTGLLVWPLLVLMAIVLRLPGSVAVLLTSMALVVGIPYTFGNSFILESIGKSFAKPLEIVPFALMVLGAAFDEPMLVIGRASGRDWEAFRIPVTVIAGALGVGYVAYLSVVTVRKADDRNRHRVAMLFTMGFFVASSALIAIGRTQLTLKLALTSRYVTSSLLFWACLLVFVTSASLMDGRSRSALRTYGLRVAALLLAFVVGGLPQIPKIAYAADTERYLAEGEYAFINGVFAMEAWSRFFNVPGAMIPVVRHFREHRLSSFSQEWTQWIGEPLATRFQVSPASECVGAWESVSPVGGSYNPAALGVGWGYDLQYKRAPDLVIFADTAERIVGFASGTRRRADLAAHFPFAASNRVGWVAYLSAADVFDLSAYVLLGDRRRVCKVGQAHIPGAYLTAPAIKAGAAIENVHVEAHGNWTRGWTTEQPTRPPFPTEVWNSQSVTSGNASLRIGTVPCGPGVSIGLPLITSKAASEIRVSVVERGSGEVLARATPPPGLSNWDLWRLDVPVGAPPAECEYIVEDNDGNPDGWVVAGLPRTVSP